MKNHMPIASLQDVRVLPSRGPWPTKSGGQLRQRFQMPLADLKLLFLAYPPRSKSAGPDIRGLRMYSVDGIPQGTIGANEFHRWRTEIVIAHRGSFRWTCTDTQHNRQEYVLGQTQALLVPPMILHTYECLSDHGSLLIVASTTFDPANKDTHDSYSTKEFAKACNSNRSAPLTGPIARI